MGNLCFDREVLKECKLGDDLEHLESIGRHLDVKKRYQGDQLSGVNEAKE